MELLPVPLDCTIFRVNYYHLFLCHSGIHITRTTLQVSQWLYCINLQFLFFKAAQQIMELQEAAQINQGLQPANITRSTSLHDIKAIVKTWRYELLKLLLNLILYCYMVIIIARMYVRCPNVNC